MKITFICAVFPPEREPTGVMAHQLAARLASDGHSVSVVAPFPNRPLGRVYAGFRRRLRKVESNAEGYRLVHCANWLVGKRRWNLNRLMENITFGCSSTWSAWREGPPDVMIVETWPLFAAQFPILLARYWGVPYLYYVKDVYPEAAEEVGVISNAGAIARFCRRWDRQLCMGDGKVIVISEGMRDLLAASRDVPKQRFTVIPDWISAAEFPVHPIENSWRREQGIQPGCFVAMFGGTLSLVSGATVLVDAAALLRDVSDVQIVCTGEGMLKPSMMERSRRLGLQNIRFLPFQPARRVPEVQGAANATILTVQSGYPDASVPSKLISYMAAGRAVICAAPERSAVSRAVREAGGGIVTPPADAEAIAAAIRRLAADRAACARLGENAREYFEAHYTFERAYPQFLQVIREVVHERAGARAECPLPNTSES